jgi:hypothetical protein
VVRRVEPGKSARTLGGTENRGSSSAKIIGVVHMLQSNDRPAVDALGHRDVRHRGRVSGAVPGSDASRKPDAVPRRHIVPLFALALDPTDVSRFHLFRRVVGTATGRRSANPRTASRSWSLASRDTESCRQPVALPLGLAQPNTDLANGTCIGQTAPTHPDWMPTAVRVAIRKPSAPYH